MVRPHCDSRLPRNSADFRPVILSKFREAVTGLAAARPSAAAWPAPVGALDRPGPRCSNETQGGLPGALAATAARRRLHHGQHRITPIQPARDSLESDPAYDYAEDAPVSDAAETEDEEFSKRPTAGSPGPEDFLGDEKPVVPLDGEEFLEPEENE